MPFAVKSQKTGHLCGAPFCLLGRFPQTPLCVSLKLAAHRAGAFLLILRNLLLMFLLVKSEHIFGVCLVDHQLSHFILCLAVFGIQDAFLCFKTADSADKSFLDGSFVRPSSLNAFLAVL